MGKQASNDSKSSSSAGLFASCHCGTINVKVESLAPDSTAPTKISLCHCTSCRHATGLLCTSYLPISIPKSPHTAVMSSFGGTKAQRYFCPNCGCHVFLSRINSEPENLEGGGDGEKWEVATGVLNDVASHVQIDNHVFVEDTNDGGLSIWIRQQNNQLVVAFPKSAATSGEVSVQTSPSQAQPTLKNKSADVTKLQASCFCGTVRFHVTRPDASSTLPKSPFPDLMIPYHTEDLSIRNPENKTWWLCSGNTKFLAGTCACRSCRLTSGFEIQTWAFIPRSNIYFHIPKNETPGTFSEILLDFGKLPLGTLHSYESSPGVMREFCGTCGASVFWHDKWRPELVDVSIGLFDAEEGARAESWLEWWTERVSFEEDAAADRSVKDGDVQFDLIPGLKRGLAECRERE